MDVDLALSRPLLTFGFLFFFDEGDRGLSPSSHRLSLRDLSLEFFDIFHHALKRFLPSNDLPPQISHGLPTESGTTPLPHCRDILIFATKASEIRSPHFLPASFPPGSPLGN